MQRRNFKTKKGPEAKIQEALIEFLKVRDWVVKATHGNMFQSGFPDLYCSHYTHGPRWVEVKNGVSYEFTPAQIEWFPKLTSHGTRIWILVEASEEEYKKLFQPPNWESYLISNMLKMRSVK